MSAEQPQGVEPPAGGEQSAAAPVPPPEPTVAATPPPLPPPPGYGQAPAYGYPGQAPYGYQDPYAKSKVVAGLLGIFLGGLGIHRFYLGFTTIGIVQILVTLVTCGLGAIWGLVEGILYLTGASGFTTDADGRPLRD